MRKFLISIVAVGSVLAYVAPASAQSWAPPTYNYPPYHYGYGFNGLNFARAMQRRVVRIRRDVRSLQARHIISWQEARSLENQAITVQERIWRASRNGIQPGEARRLESAIRRLEYRVSHEATERNHWQGYRRY